MKKVFIFFLVCIYSSSISQTSLTPFDFKGADSLIQCQVAYRYNDLVRYFNNMTDQNLDAQSRLHSKLALWKLLGDDAESGSQQVGIEDESIEGKLNYIYKRTEYIDKINQLATIAYSYQKDFVISGCAEQEGINTYALQIDEAIDYKYESPIYNFKFPFIEKSIKSDSVKSSLRNGKSIIFKDYLKSKTLKGRISKVIISEEFENYKDVYNRLSNEYLSLKEIDSRKTDVVARRKIIFDSLILVEENFTKKEMKFKHIFENNKENVGNKLKELKKDQKLCSCEIIEPQDNDKDGFNIIVDCNDDNPNIFPGAPVNCNDESQDDNCDGITDSCCDDLDQDGYFSGTNCDCFKTANFGTLTNRCDCNDNDNTVYPGAQINCENNYLDDNCDGIIDSLQLNVGKEIKITGFDRIYPPWALTKFGKDNSFYSYSTALLVTTGFATYYKIKSNKYYTNHKNSTTLRNQDELYEIANENHKKFIVATATTVGIFAISQLDLSITYYKHKKLENQIKQRRKDCSYLYKVEILPYSLAANTFGPSININF